MRRGEEGELRFTAGAEKVCKEVCHIARSVSVVGSLADLLYHTGTGYAISDRKEYEKKQKAILRAEKKRIAAEKRARNKTEVAL